MNTTVVSVGGNTINATTYSGTALTANNASYLGGVISSSYVSTTGNFTVAGTIGYGNSTVNALSNSVLFQLSNSTSVANLTPLALTIGSVISNSSGHYGLLTGNVTGNTVIASANLNTNSVYATNVYATTVAANVTGILTGNVNAVNVTTTTMTGNVVAITVSSSANVSTNSVFATNVNATTVTANVTGILTGNVNAVTVSATTVTANVTGILTGNVNAVNVATTTMNGNVVATTVSATTVTANVTGILTGNVVAATVSASANVTVGATVFINTTAVSVGGNTINATTYSGSALTSNNATYFGGYTWAAPSALGATTANTGRFTTLTTTGNTSLGANIVITSTAGVSANGSYGSANQVLTSNGTAVYWGTGASLSQTYTAVTGAGTTAVKFTRYHLDSTGGPFTITLPSSAAAGDWVQFIDAGQVAGSNNITVAPNSLNIENSTASLVININRAAFYLVYNSTYGWVLA
jgi:hypothetical protein